MHDAVNDLNELKKSRIRLKLIKTFEIHGNFILTPNEAYNMFKNYQKNTRNVNMGSVFMFSQLKLGEQWQTYICI